MDAAFPATYTFVFWINVRGKVTERLLLYFIVSRTWCHRMPCILLNTFFLHLFSFFPSWPLKTGPDMSKNGWN